MVYLLLYGFWVLMRMIRPAYNANRASDITWDLPGTAWANTEFRSYTFDEDDEANAGIRETPESRKRRGKKGRQLTRAEQTKMFEMAMQRLEHQEGPNPGLKGRRYQV